MNGAGEARRGGSHERIGVAITCRPGRSADLADGFRNAPTEAFTEQPTARPQRSHPRPPGPRGPDFTTPDINPLRVSKPRRHPT